METEEIVNIERIKNDLHYIRRYTGDLKYKIPLSNQNSVPIKFSIESDAIGNAKAKMEFLGPIDYPLIPARKKAIELILDYNKKGLLR